MGPSDIGPAFSIGGYMSNSTHRVNGIVISTQVERQVRGLGRAQLKLKSMAFLEKEAKG